MPTEKTAAERWYEGQRDSLKKDSIQAALNPADTNYYYFLLIDRDGYSNHTFSETYDEHLAAIEQANQDLA